MLSRYRRYGFISAVKVLSSNEVSYHRKHLEDIESKLCKSIHDLNKVHTVIRSPFELATHPILVNLVLQIIGPKILLHNVTFIIKEPSSKKFVSWHLSI